MNINIDARPYPVMNAIPEKCYICELDGSSKHEVDGCRMSELQEVHCKRCGKYRITYTAYTSLGRLEVPRHILSAAFRYLSDRGRVPVLDINDEGKGNELEIVQSFPIPRDPLDMVDLFLEGISLMQGKTIIARPYIAEEQYSIIGASFQGDLNATRKLAEDLSYISSSNGSNATLYILPEGWKRIRELRNARPSGNKAFVAMHFTDEMKGIYNKVLKPVLEAQGYEVAQTIDPVHNGKIDDFIIAEIRKSSLMIADFSEHRPNVYFEAGFAFGLNIEVIKTIKKSEHERHFDTRQYNHIEWTNEEDLRAQLIHRIESLPVRPKKVG